MSDEINGKKPRSTISISDFKLRLFVDTNVLIDYLEDINEDVASNFLKILKDQRKCPVNIEIVTSDYVIWELYGYFKQDFYIKKMMTDPVRQWGFKQANNASREFKDIELNEMRKIGTKIKKLVEKVDEFIDIIKIMDKETLMFSETVEILLQRSKFSYKDSMVFVSAFHNKTHAHILITRDKQFRKEGNSAERFKEIVNNLPLDFRKNIRYIDFKIPVDFSSEDKIKESYKEWFEKYNQDKVIGRVIKHYSESNVLGIECSNSNFLKVGDYIYVIKINCNFDAFTKPIIVKIENENLKDFETEESIINGGKVTVKISEDFSNNNLEGAMVFLLDNW